MVLIILYTPLIIFDPPVVEHEGLRVRMRFKIGGTDSWCYWISFNIFNFWCAVFQWDLRELKYNMKTTVDEVTPSICDIWADFKEAHPDSRRSDIYRALKYLSYWLVLIATSSFDFNCLLQFDSIDRSCDLPLLCHLIWFDSWQLTTLCFLISSGKRNYRIAMCSFCLL